MTARLPRCVTSLLLGALMVLQLAAPLVGAARSSMPAGAAATRVAALERVLGHAVETCHHQDDGGQPAGDTGPCCPCSLCHVLSAACPATPEFFALVRPAAIRGTATYAQPPPRRPTTVLASASPRGPPTLA